MVIYDFKTVRLDMFGFKNPVPEQNIDNPFTEDGGKKMKLKVEKTIDIEDGKHTGKLKQINYEERKGYKYVDMLIEEDTTSLTLKCGVPQYISDNSALGAVLKNFNAKLDKMIGDELEIEDYINVGSRVEFVTIHKDKFVNILPETLKPIR